MSSIPDESKIPAARSAVVTAVLHLERARARRTPSSPELPASPLPALVTAMRAAGVPTVHAALRDWLRGLTADEREMMVALLGELPGLAGGAAR